MNSMLDCSVEQGPGHVGMHLLTPSQKEKHFRKWVGREMAQWVKALAAKSDVSSIPGTHAVGENMAAKSLTSKLAPWLVRVVSLCR